MVASSGEFLQNICSQIGAYDDDRKLIHEIIANMSKQLGSDACVVRILDNNGIDLTVYAMHGVECFPAPAKVGEGVLGRAVEIKKPILIDDTSITPCSDCKKAIESKYRSILALPLVLLGKAVGGIMLYSNESAKFSKLDLDFVMSMIVPIAAVIENRRISRDTISTFVGLARALEIKDPYTQGHSERVTLYSVGVGVAMGLDPEELRAIKLAGPMHDIGKVGVSENILHKPSKLSKEEWETMLKHPEIGERIVETVSSLRGSLSIIRSHHENHDGSGYPDKIGGEDVPRSARVIHVADAYDAMTSDRPYRSGMPHKKAIAELRRCSGTQFDPEVVDAFCDTITGPQEM